jgi:hypothetical protein
MKNSSVFWLQYWHSHAFLANGFSLSLAFAGFACTVLANLSIDPFYKERHPGIALWRISSRPESRFCIETCTNGGDVHLHILVHRGNGNNQRPSRNATTESVVTSAKERYFEVVHAICFQARQRRCCFNVLQRKRWSKIPVMLNSE